MLNIEMSTLQPCMQDRLSALGMQIIVCKLDAHDAAQQNTATLPVRVQYAIARYQLILHRGQQQKYSCMCLVRSYQAERYLHMRTDLLCWLFNIACRKFLVCCIAVSLHNAWSGYSFLAGLCTNSFLTFSNTSLGGEVASNLRTLPLPS